MALKMMCGQAPTLRNFGNRDKAQGKKSDTSCPLCKNYSQYHNNGYTGDRHGQDLMHVLNSCNYSLKAGRFLNRHNTVLEKIAERLSLASSIANEDDPLVQTTNLG